MRASQSFGLYTAHDRPNDAVHDVASGRMTHVTGPDVNGRICPVASCRTFADAVARAKEFHEASIKRTEGK